MANTEDIEARLCAYVDGELDEAAKAEIERHLGSNPQHRALIDDLIEQRQMLRALPRARAPLDVAETLNAQLERAALLNDDHDEWHQPLRINRWPQFRAAAAVLLLVFGLAAVVYYVVPVPGTNANNGIALNAPPAARDADGSLRAESTEAIAPSTGPATGTVLTGSGEPDADFLAGVDRSPAFALGDALPETHQALSNAIAPAAELIVDAFRASRAREDASRVAPPVARANQVKVVLVTADPFAAQQQVEEFLQNHEIRMERSLAPLPPPLVLDPSQTAYGGRVPQASRVQVRTADGKDQVVAIPDLPGSLQPQAQPTEQDSTGAPLESTPRQAAVEQPAETQYVARKLTRRQVDLLQLSLMDAAGHEVQLVEEVAPATQPAFVPVEMALHGISVPALMPWTRQFVLIPATTQPDDLAGPSDERVDVTIVVRGVAPAAEAPEEEDAQAQPDDAPSQDDEQRQQQGEEEDQLEPDGSDLLADSADDVSALGPTTSPTTEPTSP